MYTIQIMFFRTKSSFLKVSDDFETQKKRSYLLPISLLLNAHFKKDRSLKFNIRPTDGICVKKPKQTYQNKRFQNSYFFVKCQRDFRKEKSWIEPL